MSSSIIRTAHGNGAGALLRAETTPLVEISPLNPELTERGLAARKAAGRPFEPGNSAGKGRKPLLARMPPDAPTAHPRWTVYRKQASRYTQRRCRELAVASGGYLGAGPSAMLASAGLALAASRLLYELASIDMDPALFKQAASLADSARQQELTAVGLAEREAAASYEDDATRVRRERLETAHAITVASQRLD